MIKDGFLYLAALIFAAAVLVNLPKIFKGKKIVLLTTYGDSEEEFSGVQNIINNIKMLAQMLEMDFVHNLNISTFKVSIEQNIDAQEKAYELGKKIIKGE